METIECQAIPQDSYPAGLGLACNLWTEIEKQKDTKIEIREIKRFWDGVKLTGSYRKHPFEIEMNYATQDIVLLKIQILPRLLDTHSELKQLAVDLKAYLEKIINSLPGRKMTSGF
jgi:hypothetical protein